MPASANLFVRFGQLAEVDEALHRAHAWRLLPLLSGASADNATPLDLRAAVTRFLGPGSTISIDELMHAEMGIAASSWSQLDGAVWYVRIEDEAVLDRWFPHRRGNRGGNSRRAYSFRTDDGIRVCVHGNVVAMARRAGETSLLRETMALMRGRRGDTLRASPKYRSLVKHLPPRPLALVYMAGADTGKTVKSHSAVLWPAIDRAVVGMYEGDGRIELAIRARLLTPYRQGRLSHLATRRLLRLPQTTLLAAAFTIDFEQTFAQAAANPTSGPMGRYLTLFEALRGPAPPDPQPTTLLGEHVIVAWGQDLSQRGSTPQLALLLECGDARALRDEVNTVAGNLVNLLKAFDSAARTHPPTIQHSTHLGTTVTHVPLRSYAERSEVPLVQLLANLEPAWATIGNWFVFALSRDHLERILDAQIGLSPPLAAVRDLRALSLRNEDLMVLATVRAGLATDALDRWLGDLDAGKPSLLDMAWWQAPTSPTGGGFYTPSGRQFGIAMKERQEQSGTVEVARVYADTPAATGLQPGDRIIGIDGSLLDLSRPSADLRRRLEKSTADPGPTLRVQRGATTLDVLLPRDPNRDRKESANQNRDRKESADPNRDRRSGFARQSNPVSGGARSTSLRDEREAPGAYSAINPADAVRELASLGRTLQFAIFSVQASQEGLYSARLTLRFPPAQTPKPE